MTDKLAGWLAGYAEYFNTLFPLALLYMLSAYAGNPGWDAGYPGFLCRFFCLAMLCKFAFDVVCLCCQCLLSL
jgi:hypothetical protein